MRCKICDSETEVTFEIKRVDYPICVSCSSTIFLSQARAYALNKSIFEISENKIRKPVNRHPEIAAEVLNYLYGTLLKQRNDFTADNIPKGYLYYISARVNDGHTMEEMKAVAYLKYNEWKDTDKMVYVRPDTLYRPQNFARYLSEVQVKKPDWKIVSTDKQKRIIKELNSYGIKGQCNDETDALARELMATGYDRKNFLNLYLINKIQ